MKREAFSGRAWRLAHARGPAGKPISVDDLRRAQRELDQQKGHAVTIDVEVTGRPWSAARPTDCACGRRHGSRLEARLCTALRALEAPADGRVLFQQLRLPALTLAPRERGAAFYVTIDFGLVERGRLVGLWDAKGRRSRDWARGRAAIEAAYGLAVREVTAADLPAGGLSSTFVP